MLATFNCPHCKEQYPRSPSLIGRRVRCRSCRDVFQLQGDGSVLRITIDTQATVNEGKEETGRDAAQRQKNDAKQAITERIARSKSSLREAAKNVLDQSDERQVGDVAKGEQKLRTNVVLTGSSNKIHIHSKIIIYILIVLIFLLSVLVFIGNPKPWRRALDHYGETVVGSGEEHPQRMNAYRSRMWIYSRDGRVLPPVVINAEEADLELVSMHDWIAVVEHCRSILKGMSLSRKFGIWVSSEKLARVETLWDEFVSKGNLTLFYSKLSNENIDIVHCDQLPLIFEEKGHSNEIIYLVSLLLAGTKDSKGVSCRDFGLMSRDTADEVHIYKFNGEKSITLIDDGDKYSLSSSGPYCGLVAGFIGVNEEPDQWRVLDIRFGNSINDFYKKSFNPLRLLSSRARMNLTAEFEELTEDVDDWEGGDDR